MGNVNFSIHRVRHGPRDRSSYNKIPTYENKASSSRVALNRTSTRTFISNPQVTLPNSTKKPLQSKSSYLNNNNCYTTKQTFYEPYANDKPLSYDSCGPQSVFTDNYTSYSLRCNRSYSSLRSSANSDCNYCKSSSAYPSRYSRCTVPAAHRFLLGCVDDPIWKRRNSTRTVGATVDFYRCDQNRSPAPTLHSNFCARDSVLVRDKCGISISTHRTDAHFRLPTCQPIGHAVPACRSTGYPIPACKSTRRTALSCQPTGHTALSCQPIRYPVRPCLKTGNPVPYCPAKCNSPELNPAIEEDERPVKSPCENPASLLDNPSVPNQPSDGVPKGFTVGAIRGSLSIGNLPGPILTSTPFDGDYSENTNNASRSEGQPPITAVPRLSNHKHPTRDNPKIENPPIKLKVPDKPSDGSPQNFEAAHRGSVPLGSVPGPSPARVQIDGDCSKNTNTSNVKSGIPRNSKTNNPIDSKHTKPAPIKSTPAPRKSTPPTPTCPSTSIQHDNPPDFHVLTQIPQGPSPDSVTPILPTRRSHPLTKTLTATDIARQIRSEISTAEAHAPCPAHSKRNYCPSQSDSALHKASGSTCPWNSPSSHE